MNANNFKTQLCQHWQRTGGNCPYGDMCLFAHGVEDLRTVDSKFSKPQQQNMHHPLFKTEICRFVLTKSPCPYSAARMCQFLHPGDEGFEEKMRAHQTVLDSKPPPQPTLESFFKSRLSRRGTEKKGKGVWGTQVCLPVEPESKRVERDTAQVKTKTANEVQPKTEVQVKAGFAKKVQAKPEMHVVSEPATQVQLKPQAQLRTEPAKKVQPKPECKSGESDNVAYDSAATNKKDIRKIRKKLRRIEQYNGRSHDELTEAQQQLVSSKSHLHTQLNKLLEAESATTGSKEIWEQATKDPKKEVWEEAKGSSKKGEGEIWERALNTLRLGARYPTPSVLSNLRA